MIESLFVQITDPGLDRFLDGGWRGRHEVFTSLEGENPGGSIKDRMVIGALAALRETGRISESGGACIVESSAGSTASSLAHYCREAGVPCALFVPDTLDAERMARLRDAGAAVHALSLASDWENVFAEYCARPGVIPFCQHTDSGKTAFYRELGRDIATTLGEMAVLIGAVGTGHSLLGTGEGLRESYPLTVVTAEPVPGAAVSGIRNLEATRHGKDDFCRPELFDRRLIVAPEDYFPGHTLQTTLGEIAFPDSFRVTLGALRILSQTHPAARVFALGAANRRVLV